MPDMLTVRLASPKVVAVAKTPISRRRHPSPTRSTCRQASYRCIRAKISQSSIGRAAPKVRALQHAGRAQAQDAKPPANLRRQRLELDNGQRLLIVSG